MEASGTRHWMSNLARTVALVNLVAVTFSEEN